MSDIVGELLKSIDGNVPVATAKLIDRAADEIAALRSALSDARAEARREALEAAANLIDGREWDTVIYEETTGDMLENIVSAIRALSQKGEQG